MQAAENNNNDEGGGGEENYELTQEDLVNLTQQFADHTFDEETDADDTVADADANANADDDDDEQSVGHRNLTQNPLSSDDEDEEIADSSRSERTDASANANASASDGVAAAALQRQESIEPFLQPGPAKRRRVHQDTDREVRIEVRGDTGVPIEKIFRLKEMFKSSSSKKGEIYIIEKFHARGQTTKSAECRVLMRLKDTYIGPSKLDNDYMADGQEPTYVSLYETKTIPLRLLDIGPIDRTDTFPPKESKTIIWHPNKKGNTGVGFKIAYSVATRKRNEDDRRKSLPASAKSEITCLELFAGAGGMSQGLRAAGLTMKWAVEQDPSAVDTWKMNHLHDGAIVFPEDLESWFEKVKEGKQSPYNEIKGNLNHTQ